MAKGLTDAQLDAMDEMDARQNLYGAAVRVLEAPAAAPMTDAQMDQRVTSNSVMQATPFGQATMPQSAPQPPQADFREPPKPMTDAELNAQEDNLYYDPSYEMPFEEFAPVHARRQEEKNTVGSFVDGAIAAGQGLVSLTAEMGQELKDNATSNFYRPDRFATQNFVTLKEAGRKAGLEFAKLVDWVGISVRDRATHIDRQDRVRGGIAQKLQAAGKLSGDPEADAQIINREFAAAKERGETVPTPLEENADVEQAFEDYRRGKNFDREIAGVGNYQIGQTPVTQESSEARATNPFTGEVMEPQRALATGGAMAFAPDNILPVGAGLMSKARILRRLASITGTPLQLTEKAANVGADALQRGAMRITDRVQDLTGMNAMQQTATATFLTGGVGYLSTQSQGGLAAAGGVATGLLSILPIMKFGGAILRRTGATAGGGYAIVREMGAGGAGVAGAEAAQAMAGSGVFPQRYARHMQPGGASADSTLRRVAQDRENPQMLRRLSRTANNLGATQAFRLADDVVSSAAVSGLAAAPFALVAPDAEQGGQIVGGALMLGTLAGTATRTFGRRPAEVDADIARMLVDVTESNGDASSLMSLSHDSLSQLAAMQGVLRNKVRFIPLRGQDYRANADLRAAGGETAAGLYIEKDASGSARIFVNMGHTAPAAGTVSVRPDADKGGSVIDITAADGTVDSTHVPQGIRLLVKTGDTVSANQRLAQDLSPTRIVPHEIGHAILTSDILDGQPRNDLRNLVNQQYSLQGVTERGREYATRLVDKDILVGATENSPVNLTEAQLNDIASGKTTVADVLKGQPVSEQARQRLIDQRIEELSQRKVEQGQDPLDWARDEIIAETFASEAPAIDFRAIRRDALFPRVAESMLAAGGRVLEVMGVRLDPGTGKLLDNPSVLFRDNPLFQDRIMQKRVREYVRGYDQYLAGLEEAGTAAPRGAELARSNNPQDMGRSTHVKLRDEGRGVLENDFLFQRPDGTYSYKPQKMINQAEASRAAQIKTLYDARKFVPVNSREFGKRKVNGRETVGGPVLPAQFDFFTHFPQHVREFARGMEQSRAEGGSWNVDYNAIGTGSSGRYRVTNMGAVRAIQRETVPFGWQVTKQNHLLAASLDLNAFRASAMKAVNKGELGIFNNDMMQLEADLKTYLANHRDGLPGEATIGMAKRDMLNGLIGTGTAVQRAANPMYYELNPRGSVRTWRVDRLNDAQPSGRTGYFFDYDKINNNRMPQAIPREAQGMPDVRAERADTPLDPRARQAAFISDTGEVRATGRGTHFETSEDLGPNFLAIGAGHLGEDGFFRFGSQMMDDAMGDSPATSAAAAARYNQSAYDQGQRPSSMLEEPPGLERPAARGQAMPDADFAPARISDSALEIQDFPLRISTRTPSAKAATENPLTDQLSIDTPAIARAGALAKVTGVIGQYPGIKLLSRSPEGRAQELIRFEADNLLWLHDQVEGNIRDRSSLWYDGARNISVRWSGEYGVPRQGNAAAIAALSPQKDWYMNVSLARRVLEMTTKNQQRVFGNAEFQWASAKMKQVAPIQKMLSELRGKPFAEMTSYEKAVFTRAFDEINNPRGYEILSPEGEFLGPATNKDGSASRVAWGDFNSIAKAVLVTEDPRPNIISKALGEEHKVRSFYNNIILPNYARFGDVTIDTHAVAAALLRPLAGSDIPVLHNFGGSGAGGSAITGHSGTYGLHADAYRLAASERGILPRQMQSITWEAVRGLFAAEWKTSANKTLVDKIWTRYKKGEIDINETRKQISDAAGGITPPSWYRSNP